MTKFKRINLDKLGNYTTIANAVVDGSSLKSLVILGNDGRQYLITSDYGNVNISEQEPDKFEERYYVSGTVPNTDFTVSKCFDDLDEAKRVAAQLSKAKIWKVWYNKTQEREATSDEISKLKLTAPDTSTNEGEEIPF